MKARAGTAVGQKGEGRWDERGELVERGVSGRVKLGEAEASGEGWEEEGAAPKGGGGQAGVGWGDWGRGQMGNEDGGMGEEGGMERERVSRRRHERTQRNRKRGKGQGVSEPPTRQHIAHRPTRGQGEETPPQ